MPSFPQIALCFPSLALRPQPFLFKKTEIGFSGHLKGNGRDASASENVENGDIVYNVGDDCRANLKQSQAFIVNKISKASLADFTIWI